jgi:hypothetical protein
VPLDVPVCDALPTTSTCKHRASCLTSAAEPLCFEHSVMSVLRKHLGRDTPTSAGSRPTCDAACFQDDSRDHQRRAQHSGRVVFEDQRFERDQQLRYHSLVLPRADVASPIEDVRRRVACDKLHSAWLYVACCMLHVACFKRYSNAALIPHTRFGKLGACCPLHDANIVARVRRIGPYSSAGHERQESFAQRRACHCARALLGREHHLWPGQCHTQ